jgi:outer membrane protein OmpU
MKKVLLATTALIAASAFAAPAKADLEVTVGGFTAFQAGFFDNDTTNSSDRDFQSEAQIAVMADATADNGLQYGAKVLLDTSANDSTNADEVGIYLAGSWGRVELGDDDGASELSVFAPTVGVGQINGSYDDYVNSTALAGLNNGNWTTSTNDRGDHLFTALDSDDRTKITYYTPKFSGFQAGVSYAPEVSSGETVTLTEGGLKNFFELGVKYEGDFQGVGVAVGGVYNFADAGDLTTTEDLRSWNLGAQFSYNGFKFGGGYTDSGDSMQAEAQANDDISSWNVGATYENGPWGVGISYLNEDYDTNGDTNGTDGGDYTVWAVGGTYKVAPGLTTGADLAFYDRDRTGSASDEDGFVAVVDVTAAF